MVLYNEGGALFVTSRILIVDLLNERVPLEKVPDSDFDSDSDSDSFGFGFGAGDTLRSKINRVVSPFWDSKEYAGLWVGDIWPNLTRVSGTVNFSSCQVAGILVANCHKVSETCAEAFIVRLYR